ncbi:MAG: hypothetical protein ACFHVJ_04955 [Aestuariibacter sp.]
MRRLLWGMLGLFWMPWVSAASSDISERVQVSVYHITGMLEHKNEDLPYSKALQHLAHKLPITMDYHIFHGLRASSLFKNGVTDCLFPGSKQIQSEENLLESTPLNVAKAYFFAEKMISTEQILKSSRPKLKIGFYRGNSFGGTIKKLRHHKLTPLNSGADVRSLLERKRIDVFINYMPDALAFTNVPGKAPLQYSQASLFYEQNDSFICHDKPSTRALIAMLNKEIAQLTHSGDFKRSLHQLAKRRKTTAGATNAHSH